MQRMIDHGPSKGVGGLSGDERLKSGGTEANGVGPISERFRVVNPIETPVPAAIQVSPVKGGGFLGVAMCLCIQC